MTKYIVVVYTYNQAPADYPTADVIDADYKAYDTLAAANDAADMAWHYLTKRERACTTIEVGAVTENDLSDWAINEDDGTIDWTAVANYRTPQGALQFPGAHAE